jgi:hypothetical protein
MQYSLQLLRHTGVLTTGVLYNVEIVHVLIDRLGQSVAFYTVYYSTVLLACSTVPGYSSTINIYLSTRARFTYYCTVRGILRGQLVQCYIYSIANTRVVVSYEYSN